MDSTSTKPEKLIGMLGKLSPSPLMFGTYQKRFFILQEGVLYWSASDKLKSVGAAGLPGCKGSVDFSVNLGCEVSEDEANAARFLLKPKEGKWTKGDFTGSESGRAFNFEVQEGPDSSSRAQWIEALRAHIAYGVIKEPESERWRTSTKASGGVEAVARTGAPGGSAMPGGYADRTAPPAESTEAAADSAPAPSAASLFTVANVEELFKKYDKDSSGLLETGEMQDFFKDAFPDANAELLQELTEAVTRESHGHVGMNEVRAFLRHYNPSTQMMKVKTALIIIDVQNDFITGSLANAYNAIEILPLINGMRDKFDVVVISMDWHPADHCSFVDTCNAGKTPIVEELQEFAVFSSVTLKGDDDRAEHKQTLYPRHAVQDSEGGANHPELVVKDTDGTIKKGTKTNIDSYSAFFDNCKANDTGLTAMLEAKGVTDVYCCGLVFDICVKSSALHGAEMGFKMSVIEEACRPLSQDNVETTKAELAEAGVAILSVEKAVEEAEEANKGTERTLEDYLAHARSGKQAKAVHDKARRTMCSHFQAPISPDDES